MGFEAFQLTLENDNAAYSDVLRAVQSLKNVAPDPQCDWGDGSSYFAVRDDQHVIEIEVSDEPATISCRFAVCHPRSIDRCFLDLVELLMERLSMTALTGDPSRPNEILRFDFQHVADFESVTLQSIDNQRKLWISEFGAETARASTADAVQRFVMPHARPIRPRTDVA